MPRITDEHLKGQLRFFYQHINDEPALVIGNHSRFGQKSAYVVPLSRAYELRDDETLLSCAMNCCHVLGLGVDKYAVHKIADLMQNYLEELVKMPPAPMETDIKRAIENAQERYGLDMKVNGKRILH